MKVTRKELYLVGAGVLFPDHLTLQAIEVLGACDRVYTNLQPSEFASLPKDLRVKCESLWPMYRENRDRSSNYRDVAGAVVAAAERGRSVAWMTYGHPLVFDSVSQELLKAGRDRGWSVSILPGISSIDTVLAELGYDPASGLLIHEATSVVKRKLQLLPGVATLLLQPSAFGTSVAHLNGGWRPDLAPLQEYLLQFHAPEHDCAFVRSPQDESSASQVSWTKLRDLASTPLSALRGSTLFLPAACSRE